MEKRGKNIGDKAGAMELSFGMIFSIILIIAFIVFAFYAIKMFLGAQDQTKTATFVKDLQAQIDKIWKSPQSSQQVEYSLSTKIDRICFADDSYENLKFYPKGSSDLPPINLENLNIYNITRSRGSEKVDINIRAMCLNVTEGKVKISFDKNFGEELVRITK